MLRFRAHSPAASQGPGQRGSGEGRQSRHPFLTHHPSSHSRSYSSFAFVRPSLPTVIEETGWRSSGGACVLAMSELQSIIVWEAVMLRYLGSAEESLCEDLCTLYRCVRETGNVFETG